MAAFEELSTDRDRGAWHTGLEHRSGSIEVVAATELRQATGFDGSRLTAARERLGLTRADLARRLNTGWEVVLQWENGECQPRPRSIPAIAAAVDVPISELYPMSHGLATLADRRKAAGLNQADIATALGVSRATVSQWERGARPVPAHYRSAYDQLLGPIGNDTANADISSTESSTLRQSESTADQRFSSLATVDTAQSPTQDQNSSVIDDSPTAHLIVSTDLEFSEDKCTWNADAPKRWHVYSPQVVQVNKTSATDLNQLMDDMTLRLIKLGYRHLYGHHEQRIIIDNEPVRVVRHQTSPPDDARQHQCRLFLSFFTPDFYIEGVGEDLVAKAKLRRDFEEAFPQSVTGEMLFVIAEPTDTYGWLQDQTLPYIPYTIVSHLPEDKRYFFGPVHHDHSSVKTNDGLVSLDYLGIQRDTTVGEIADRLGRYRHP